MERPPLLEDPVFQLNLLLWMAKEQPHAGYRVRPLFYEQGFRIVYIEQPFRFPEETARAIEASGLEITSSPEPEVILGRDSDKKALYFEAKANSFGTESSKNAKQARAHLLAIGPAFKEVLSPLGECLLCYLVPADGCTPMSYCLKALCRELNRKHLHTGPFSVHGLALRGPQVIYSWDAAFKKHVGLQDDEVAVLDNVTEETDPTPLILVFCDDDCSNNPVRDLYRQAVIDQALACLLCDLHSHAVGKEFETTSDELLMKISDGVFQYLGRDRQKALRQLIRERIFKRIHEYWAEKNTVISLTGNTFAIRWRVIGEKEEFLDWLEDRRTKFDPTKPQEHGPTLFDDQIEP